MITAGQTTKISERRQLADIALVADVDVILITGNPNGAILDNIILPPNAKADFILYIINISGDGYFIDDEPPSNIADAGAGFNLSTNRPFGLIYNDKDKLWYPIF